MKISTAALGVILLTGLPGVVFAADKMTDAQIQEKLKADGYTNVQITEHDRDHVDVKATKNGKTEKLAVNPQTGAVAPDNDND
jgi:hypothetical protein